MLGVDHFAWKKRFTYGTILVDLERRKIIDVLADRDSATVETWLNAHPEIAIVIRDRGKDFAKAATLGAPQAQQVVDRFHLVRNLSEVLQEILGHCRAEIRQLTPISATPKAAGDQPSPLPTPATWQQRTPPAYRAAHQVRQLAAMTDFVRSRASGTWAHPGLNCQTRMGCPKKRCAPGSNGVQPRPGSASLGVAVSSILMGVCVAALASGRP